MHTYTATLDGLGTCSTHRARSSQLGARSSRSRGNHTTANVPVLSLSLFLCCCYFVRLFWMADGGDCAVALPKCLFSATDYSHCLTNSSSDAATCMLLCMSCLNFPAVPGDGERDTSRIYGHMFSPTNTWQCCGTAETSLHQNSLGKHVSLILNLLFSLSNSCALCLLSCRTRTSASAAATRLCRASSCDRIQDDATL